MKFPKIHKKSLIIGITGSIGTGKTTLSRFLRKIGWSIFDADDQVKQLLHNHQPTLNLLKQYWPECFEGSKGFLNKKKLANHVFSYLPDLTKLESILHPQIIKQQRQYIQHYKLQTDKIMTPIVIESPLLFETQTHTDCDYIIVTTCDPVVQRRRVLKRLEMTQELYQQIVQRQMPDREKCDKADLIIDTTDGIQQMVKRIRDFVNHCPFE